MKRTSIFFSFLLLIWITFSTYWYVCKIKNDCNTKKSTHIIKKTKPINEILEKDTINSKTNNKQKQSFAEELSKGYTIYNFPKNSGTTNKIDQSFVEFATKLKQYLAENPSTQVEIAGYTDSKGSEKTNLYFGKKRANFVKNKLIYEGIDASIMQTKSLGEANPIANNNTKEGRLKNRRVIITIIKN